MRIAYSRGCKCLASRVRDIIRREWVRTLSDLVERRLLLIFGPRLDQPRLRELAAIMADEGVIHTDQIDSEVAATMKRLQSVYGVKSQLGVSDRQK